jgi:hypothetical protein
VLAVVAAGGALESLIFTVRQPSKQATQPLVFDLQLATIDRPRGPHLLQVESLRVELAPQPSAFSLEHVQLANGLPQDRRALASESLPVTAPVLVVGVRPSLTGCPQRPALRHLR